ncbi:hypothetical protein HZS_890, partial [Henneguya salminicola]
MHIPFVTEILKDTSAEECKQLKVNRKLKTLFLFIFVGILTNNVIKCHPKICSENLQNILISFTFLIISFTYLLMGFDFYNTFL